MIEITVSSKKGEERKYNYDKYSVMIGRAAGNDILLEEGGVSRYHARLSVEGDNIVVQDLTSTNGTFVGTERVEKAVVKPSDKVTIGDYLLMMHLTDAADAKPEAAQKPAPAQAPAAASPAAEAKPVAAKEPEKQEPPKKEVEKKETAQKETAQKDAAQKEPEKKEAAPPPHKEPVKTEAPPSQPKAAEPAKGKASATLEPLSPAPNVAAAPQTAPVEVKEKPTDFYWESLRSFLAPVWTYILDDTVTEILVNGPTEIYIEKKGRMDRVAEKFTIDQLNAAVLNIAQYVGRRVSEDEPYLDARLPDGSRVAVLVPPCSRKGVSVSIRKFAKEKLTLDRLISFGSLTADMVMFIKACVLLKKNIIVSGGTSSGKTSLLNVVSGLIPDDERILTIEDAAELQLRQDHVVPMETKPPDKKGKGQVTIRDLVRASLRMRPDRIIVGEIRGGEAIDLLQAMNTGHSGSMATVHASSPSQALTRLETLALFSGLEIPIRALRDQVSTAIDVIIQATRLPDHSRKVTHISEVGMLTEDGSYRTHDVFRFIRTGLKEGKIIGSHQWTGYISKSFDEMELAGLTEIVEFFKQKQNGAPPIEQPHAGH